MKDKKADNQELKVIDTSGEQSKLLVPELVVRSNLHQDLTRPQNSSFHVPPGEVHLIQLDRDGNEVAGTDFTIGFDTYQKAFENITAEANKVLIGAKFLLKKNNPK